MHFAHIEKQDLNVLSAFPFRKDDLIQSGRNLANGADPLEVTQVLCQEQRDRGIPCSIVSGLPTTAPKTLIRISGESVIVREPKETYDGTWKTTEVVATFPTYEGSTTREWRKGEPTLKALRTLRAFVEAHQEGLGHMAPTLNHLTMIRGK